MPNPPTLTQRQLDGPVLRGDREVAKDERDGQADDADRWAIHPAARETVEMMYEFEKPFVVDDSKFKPAFGDIATSAPGGVREQWHGTGNTSTATTIPRNRLSLTCCLLLMAFLFGMKSMPKQTVAQPREAALVR